MVEPQGIGFKELGRENPPNPPESAFAFEDSEKAHPDTPESPRPLPDFTQPPPEEPTPLDRAADRLIAQASAPRPPPKPCPEGHTMSAAIALCVRCDWRGLLEVFDPGDHAQRREPRMVMVLCTHQDTGISARHASLGYCLVSREERLDVMTGLRNGATP